MMVYIAELPADKTQNVLERQLTTLFRKALGKDVKICAIQGPRRIFTSDLTLEQLSQRYTGKLVISEHTLF